MNKELYRRNEAIIKMRENGATRQAIAKQFDISVERVRQICNRENYRKRREKRLGKWLCQFTNRTGDALARKGIYTETDLYNAVSDGNCA